VDAIIEDTNLDHDIPFWVDLNKRLSTEWPNISKKKPALPDAAEWNGKPNKLDLLEE
jgi:ferredoxin